MFGELITPDNLRSVWAEIRTGIERVLRKTGEPFIPEDIYHALMDRKAVLYVHRADGKVQLFGVFVPEAEKTLFIWVCANFAGPELLTDGLAWLRAHAKEHGFERITFDSPRKGWAKHFKPLHTTYEINP